MVRIISTDGSKRIVGLLYYIIHESSVMEIIVYIVEGSINMIGYTRIDMRDNQDHEGVLEKLCKAVAEDRKAIFTSCSGPKAKNNHETLIYTKKSVRKVQLYISIVPQYFRFLDRLRATNRARARHSVLLSGRSDKGFHPRVSNKLSRSRFKKLIQECLKLYAESKKEPVGGIMDRLILKIKS